MKPLRFALVAAAVAIAGLVLLVPGHRTSDPTSLPIAASAVALDCPTDVRVAATPNRPVGRLEPRSVEDQAVRYAQGSGVTDRLHAVTHQITALTAARQLVVFHDPSGRAVMVMTFTHDVTGWTWDAAEACGDAR